MRSKPPVGVIQARSSPPVGVKQAKFGRLDGPSRCQMSDFVSSNPLVGVKQAKLCRRPVSNERDFSAGRCHTGDLPGSTVPVGVNQPRSSPPSLHPVWPLNLLTPNGYEWFCSLLLVA